MKKWMLIGALAASFSAVACAEEITGFVSDAKCGAKHDSATEANAKCATGCIKGGAAPVIVSNGKVYKVDSESVDKVKTFAGQNVKLDGTLDGDTVSVKSIEAAGS
jgi:hypothetical protein